MTMTKRRIEIRNISTGSISLFSVQKLLSIGSCKRLVDYLVMVFLNKSLTCDQAVLLPILFGRRGEGDAGFIYFTRRRPVVQNLDFCLIGRKTKDPSEPYTHRSSNISDFRSSQIGFVTLWSPSSLHDRNHEMTLKRKPLTAEMRTSCYLLRPVRISAISSPMLSCSRGQNCCL